MEGRRKTSPACVKVKAGSSASASRSFLRRPRSSMAAESTISGAFAGGSGSSGPVAVAPAGPASPASSSSSSGGAPSVASQETVVGSSSAARRRLRPRLDGCAGSLPAPPDRPSAHAGSEPSPGKAPSAGTARPSVSAAATASSSARRARASASEARSSATACRCSSTAREKCPPRKAPTACAARPARPVRSRTWRSTAMMAATSAQAVTRMPEPTAEKSDSARLESRRPTAPPGGKLASCWAARSRCARVATDRASTR